jgi:CheY-like chemotaxis protein
VPLIKKGLSSAFILLAEDDESNRKVTYAMLKRLGYRADAVSNGREALLALKSHSYDIILMNLRMPEMDGLEATREIRQHCSASQQPKIIALTAYILPNSKEICLEAGMNDFMQKPVKMNDLAAMLGKHIRILQRQTAFMQLHEKAVRTFDLFPKNRRIILSYERDSYLKN